MLWRCDDVFSPLVGTHLLAAGIKPMASGKAERVRPNRRVPHNGGYIHPYRRTHPLGLAACHRLYAGGKKVRPYNIV